MLLRDNTEDAPERIVVEGCPIEEVSCKHHIDADHRIDQQHGKEGRVMVLQVGCVDGEL